ncbi:hypothetical protein ACIOGZ_41175 [Kitasatospora sp. NPDC088160]|uniref:hypothetical protein n=1 Tax=Kitasatospora sp. NPDC088160 TaxID=3364072 RepID=UPI00382AB8DF
MMLYPWMRLRELVRACWIGADDRDQAVQQLQLALTANVPEARRHPGIEVVHRPSTTTVPRIGWM